MMRSSLLLVVLALAACRAGGRPPDSTPTPEPAALTRLLTAQLARAAADWNRGDLDGFLSDYAAESTTTFVDGLRPRGGIDFIRKNYTRYFAPGATRDSLHFEELQARPLSPTVALVTARFFLQRGDSVTASGPFTLVMERRPEGWKILHDHTSSDPR
jgi:ketosteroid isomerase-like protein